MRVVKTAILLSVILGIATACSTKPTSENAKVAPSTEQKKPKHLAVKPGAKTHVTTFHVQTEKFPAELKQEFDQTFAKLAGECWIYSDVGDQPVATSEPSYCSKFVPFSKVAHLKPYKRNPTDKKMVLTALDQGETIGVQSFRWDGKKLQRIRNSDSKLPQKNQSEDRFADFMMVWAEK